MDMGAIGAILLIILFSGMTGRIRLTHCTGSELSGADPQGKRGIPLFSMSGSCHAVLTGHDRSRLWPELQ